MPRRPNVSWSRIALAWLQAPHRPRREYLKNRVIAEQRKKSMNCPTPPSACLVPACHLDMPAKTALHDQTCELRPSPTPHSAATLNEDHVPIPIPRRPPRRLRLHLPRRSRSADAPLV